MLESLRSFVSGWVAKILLILLVGSFALWGVSGSILSGGDANTIASIGETKVSIREFLSAYNRNMGQMQQRVGRRLTRDEGRIFGVESRTLSDVVSFGALDEFARTQNISLSDETLARMIAETPAFQDSTGKFNRETFRRAVYEAQMRESDFVTAQNKSAVRSQITRAFATGTILPDVFNGAMNSYMQEERKFSYILVTPALAGTPDDPTDEELKTYFEANLKSYAAPEYRQLELLVMEPKDIADETAISDDAIAKDYEERKGSYEKPERRRVQQIVFKSQEKADEAIKSLSEGGLFETILSDNEIKISDADLGLLAKTQLPKVAQDVAFTLEMNTPSKILKGPFGPTMIRVTEIEPAKVTPLEEVKDAIRKDLALNQAADRIIEMQETVEDTRAGGASLADIASQQGLKTRKVDAIDRSARALDGTIINDLPESAKLLAQAFKTEVGAQASPIDLSAAGYMWYDVIKVTPARDRTLTEIKDKVKADWITAEQAKMVEKKAEELKARLEKGVTLPELALEFSTDVKTTELLKRNAEAGDFTRAATAAGFAGDKDHLAVVASGDEKDRLLIAVTEIKRPESKTAAVPAEQIRVANEGAADDLLNQLITKLQAEYAVTQNPTLINQVLTRN